MIRYYNDNTKTKTAGRTKQMLNILCDFFLFQTEFLKTKKFLKRIILINR